MNQDLYTPTFKIDSITLSRLIALLCLQANLLATFFRFLKTTCGRHLTRDRDLNFPFFKIAIPLLEKGWLRNFGFSDFLKKNFSNKEKVALDPPLSNFHLAIPSMHLVQFRDDPLSSPAPPKILNTSTPQTYRPLNSLFHVSQ